MIVTGSRGMLGTDVVNLFQEQYEVLGCDLHNCDILQNEAFEQVVASFRPEVIIHTAAYTNVDKAESDEEAAFRLNAMGTKHVAAAANTYHAKLVHISTDYVFDGTSARPYTEEDIPHPMGVYGRTKLQAEQEVQRISQDFLIVRIAWLYGRHGKNFVSAILQRAQEEGALQVVHDQTGSPTYTQDVARGILALLAHSVSGIVHLTNSGQCTWYDFAKTILEYAGMPQVTIQAISAAELRRPAPRPGFSVLDTSKFTAITGQKVRDWQEGLAAYFNNEQ